MKSENYCYIFRVFALLCKLYDVPIELAGVARPSRRGSGRKVSNRTLKARAYADCHGNAEPLLTPRSVRSSSGANRRRPNATSPHCNYLSGKSTISKSSGNCALRAPKPRRESKIAGAPVSSNWSLPAAKRPAAENVENT